MPIRTLAVLVAIAGWCGGQATPSISSHDGVKYVVTGLEYAMGGLPNETSILDNKAELLEGCDIDLNKIKFVTEHTEKRTFSSSATEIHAKCDFNLKTRNITDNETCEIKHNYVLTPLKARNRKTRHAASWTEYIKTRRVIPKSSDNIADSWKSKYISHPNPGPKPFVPMDTYHFGDDQSNADSWKSIIRGNWPDKKNSHIDQDTCGKVTLTNPYPLVVNPKPTLIGQWPWQVVLLHYKQFHCGGTLVSKQHVVTAAHCVTLDRSEVVVNRDVVSISLGVHNLRTSTVGVQNKDVEDIRVHPQYSGSTYVNDISVIKLVGSVEITDYVRHACLWPENDVDLSSVIGKTGIVVGWGENESHVSADELGLVRMPIVSQQQCLNVNRLYLRYRWDTTFCAGARDETTACFGDSGGGLVLRKHGTWYLRGLVSLTINKCDAAQYIIFTDVAKFLPWLKENMN